MFGPRITRRSVLIAAAASLVGRPARAAAAKPHLIVMLHASAASARTAAFHDAFLQGLRERGYADRGVAIEERFADLHLDRLPALAAEIVRLRPEVIVTAGTAAARAAKHATQTIPVVMAVSGDPVRSGLVASLARPGGNLTGSSLDLLDIIGKQLQLLKTVVPAARRIGALIPSAAPGPFSTTYQEAAARLDVEIVPAVARRREDLLPAFSDMVKTHVNAIYVLVYQLSLLEAERIAALAMQNRLPAIYGERANVQAGGPMSYGPDNADLFRRAASYVDKILKGARPADLPIEQPTRFPLVMNLRAAKAIGLTFPPDIMARADAVIE
jgi:ABC-type uncharacterized transport system substrate-binding protein